MQCLSNGDCTNGDLCASATHTCQPPPEGGEGEACFTTGLCNTGLLCIDEGGAAPVCRAQCDPANDTVCANISASDVCEWLNFDGSGVLIGICEPGNGHGQTGAACDPSQIDSCEWNLLCAATSSSGGVCSALCTPGSSCNSGTCNAIVGALGTSGQPLQMGYCGGATSKWGTACVTDTSASGPNCGDALGGAGSGSALFCIPATLPAEFPAVNLLSTCQYGPAASTALGGTDTSCSALSGKACRTGICLADGSQTCFAGCQYNADCTRDCTAEGGCATTSDCFAVNFSEGSASGVIGTCEPICRDDLDCPAGSCQPAPVMSGTSWQAICGPVSGAGKAGSACAGGAVCESGVCLTASTLEAIELGVTASGATATDGFCLGACLPSASDCATGSSCSTIAALPLSPTSTGDLGVVGKVSPGICFGSACATDTDCAGISADPNTPRVCAPYKTATLASVDTAKKCTTDANCTGSSNWVATCNTSANNPNPGSAYGSNAGIFGPNGACRAVRWSLGCLPSQGASKSGGGAACVTANDCQTGHCVNNGTVSYCFGGCTSDTDCAGGTTCQSGTYLGLSGKHCMP